MAFIMTLWIGHVAVLKSSSQWQLKELKKKKKKKNHGRNYSIFKIHLIGM